MKILLDIDGVMIPARPWQTYQMSSDGFGMFNNLSVKSLNDIINSSQNPEIILSTSHKHSYSLKQWENIFSSRGIIKTKISRLNTNSMKTSRIEEVRSWHLKNQNKDFIIIDDDKGLNALETSFKKEHLVLTNATIGLNKFSKEEAINKIENILESIDFEMPEIESTKLDR